MEVDTRGDIDGRWSQHCRRTWSDHSVESVGSIGFGRLAVVVAVGSDRRGIRTVPVDRGVTEGWFHVDTGRNGDVTKLAAVVAAGA